MSDNPVADELRRDYPTLWDDSIAFDFAEKLGGCTDTRLREIDQAMHELWLSRSAKRGPSPDVLRDEAQHRAWDDE